MKTVSEPSNALEGHMLQDLLRQRGIDSRLEGAGLQGALGELPATGLVRLVVEDADLAAAKAVIDEWDKTAVPDPIKTPPTKPVGALVGALVGAILGFGVAYIIFHVPTNANGIDYNGDGILDVRWNYSPGGTLISMETDRNLDRIVDYRMKFDRQGHEDAAELDDDFNGSFESTMKFRNGSVYVMAIDTDEDSIADLRYLYQYGVLIKGEYTRKGSANPVRAETIRLGKLISADVDTDRDGRLDRRYIYDDVGEIASTDEIETAP